MGLNSKPEDEGAKLLADKKDLDDGESAYYKYITKDDNAAACYTIQCHMIACFKSHRTKTCMFFCMRIHTKKHSSK